MRKLKLLPIVSCAAIAATTIPVTVACSSNSNFDDIKTQQVGLTLTAYFETYRHARSDEAWECLQEGKNLLLPAFDKANTIGQIYGLGCLGGANYDLEEKPYDRYHGLAGQGVFFTCSRIPDFIAKTKTLETTTINLILELKNETRSEMIGLSASVLFEAIALSLLDGEVSITFDKYIEFAEYTNNAIIGAKSNGDATSIAYASTGFYTSCQRQPTQANLFFEQFKDYVDSLSKK